MYSTYTNYTNNTTTGREVRPTLYNSSRQYLMDTKSICEPLNPRKSALGVSWYLMGPDGRGKKHPMLPSRYDYLDCPNGYCAGSQSRGYVTPHTCSVLTSADPPGMLPL